jgi:hypothetical protein
MNLDGRVVRIGARAWQIHLFGTRTVECQRWVRVALLGRPSYSVLLKMTLTAAASEAIHALEWWLVSPGQRKRRCYRSFVARMLEPVKLVEVSQHAPTSSFHIV